MLSIYFYRSCLRWNECINIDNLLGFWWKPQLGIHWSWLLLQGCNFLFWEALATVEHWFMIILHVFLCWTNPFFPIIGAVVGELWAIFTYDTISSFTWTGKLRSKRGLRITLFFQLIQGPRNKFLLLPKAPGDAMPPHLLYLLSLPVFLLFEWAWKLDEVHRNDPWWNLPAPFLYISWKIYMAKRLLPCSGTAIVFLVDILWFHSNVSLGQSTKKLWVVKNATLDIIVYEGSKPEPVLETNMKQSCKLYEQDRPAATVRMYLLHCDTWHVQWCLYLILHRVT